MRPSPAGRGASAGDWGYPIIVTREGRAMRNLLRLVGCLALAALLLSGATARADEKKDTDKKQEKKKDKKKDDKLDAPFPDLEKLLDALGGGLDEEQLKKFRQRMDKMREMLKQMQKGGGLPGGFGGGFGLGGGL